MKLKDELTRIQAAHRLKCSQTQCLRFEQKGLLHARRELPQPGFTAYRIYYKAEEVAALAKWWKPTHGRSSVEASIIRTNERGKYAAKAFVMFRDGKCLADVVIALEVDPLMIRQLYEEWKLTFEGAADLEKKRRREIEALNDQRASDRREAALEGHAHKRALAKIAADAVIEAAREAARETAKLQKIAADAAAWEEARRARRA